MPVCESEATITTPSPNVGSRSDRGVPANYSSCLRKSQDVVERYTSRVSAKHLQAYLNEYTFRFNRRFYPFNAFRSLLGIAGDAMAPTYAGLYSGDWTHPTCSGCMC